MENKIVILLVVACLFAGATIGLKIGNLYISGYRGMLQQQQIECQRLLLSN